MAPEPRSKRYVILNDGVSGGELESFLGRVVANYREPLDDFVRPTIEPEIDTVMDEGFFSSTSSNDNSEVKFKIGRALGIDFEKAVSEERTIESGRVRTQTLMNSSTYFTAMHKKQKEGILRMVEMAPKGEAYMVIGLKYFKYGKMKLKKEAGGERGLESELPINELIRASTGLPSIGRSVDPHFGVRREEGSHTEQRKVMIGDRIFAVRYRILKPRGILHRHSDIEAGQPLEIPDSEGILRDDHQSFVYSDDSEGDDEDFALEETEFQFSYESINSVAKRHGEDNAGEFTFIKSDV